MVEGEAFTASGAVPMQALFDTGAEVNIISQHFVVQHQLVRVEGELPQPQFINGQRAYCFGAYRVRYRLMDTWGQSRDCEHTFYALDKAGPALILGLPALKAERIRIDCGTKTWRFNIEDRPMEVQSPAEFAQEIQDEPTVYAIL